MSLLSKRTYIRALILSSSVLAPLTMATAPAAVSGEFKEAIVTVPGKEKIATVPMGQFKILATGEETGGAIGIFETSMPAGKVGLSHAHSGEVEVFYVLEGTFRFQVGEETFEGGPGFTVAIPKNVINHHENIGKTDGRLLAMEIPGGFEQFFLEVQAQKADTPAKIWELEKAFGITNSSLEGIVNKEAKAAAP